MLVRLLGIFGVALCTFSTTWCAEPLSPMKVVSYNTRYASPGDGLDVWANRMEAVASFLDQQDLAGLQEVTAAQLDDLRQRLVDFDFYGVGRDDGQRGGEHAVIFYRRDRFESLDRGTFWLSESPEQVGVAGWDAALPRTCTWIIVRDKPSGVSILVANTHFDHRGVQARAKSGELVMRLLKEKAGDLPVILLGDFNCRADSDPYRALTAEGFLVDARLASKTEPAGPVSTWNGFKKIEPGQVIDHIFVHGNLDILAAEVLDPKTEAGRFASDHLPVRAKIAIRPAADQN